MGVGTISQGFFSTGLRLGAWLVTGGGAWPGWGCGRARGRQPSSALSGFSSTWRAGVRSSEIGAESSERLIDTSNIQEISLQHFSMDHTIQRNLLLLEK